MDTNEQLLIDLRNKIVEEFRSLDQTDNTLVLRLNPHMWQDADQANIYYGRTDPSACALNKEWPKLNDFLDRHPNLEPKDMHVDVAYHGTKNSYRGIKILYEGLLESHRRKSFFGEHAKDCKQYYHDWDSGLVACLVVGWDSRARVDGVCSVPEGNTMTIALYQRPSNRYGFSDLRQGQR